VNPPSGTDSSHADNASGRALCEAAALRLASELQKELPASWGFVLVLASRERRGPAHLVANLERMRQAEVLRDVLARTVARL